MYGAPTLTTGTAAAGLAATGLNLGWLALLALTLVLVGTAVIRLAPRREA